MVLQRRSTGPRAGREAPWLPGGSAHTMPQPRVPLCSHLVRTTSGPSPPTPVHRPSQVSLEKQSKKIQHLAGSVPPTWHKDPPFKHNPLPSTAGKAASSILSFPPHIPQQGCIQPSSIPRGRAGPQAELTRFWISWKMTARYCRRILAMLHLLPLLSTATSRSSRTAQESTRGKICQGRAQSQLGIKEYSGLCFQPLVRSSTGPVPKMQHVMEEPPLSPLPKNILPDEPSPPGAKPLGSCSCPAVLAMAHTELSLMPAGGFLAQSYVRDLCQSKGLSPELSVPAQFHQIPTLCHFQAREPQVPKPKRSREEGSGLLGEKLEAGAAWSPPAISISQPKWICAPSKGCSHNSAAWWNEYSIFPASSQLMLIPGSGALTTNQTEAA